MNWKNNIMPEVGLFIVSILSANNIMPDLGLFMVSVLSELEEQCPSSLKVCLQ